MVWRSQWGKKVYYRNISPPYHQQLERELLRLKHWNRAITRDLWPHAALKPKASFCDNRGESNISLACWYKGVNVNSSSFLWRFDKALRAEPILINKAARKITGWQVCHILSELWVDLKIALLIKIGISEARLVAGRFAGELQTARQIIWEGGLNEQKWRPVCEQETLV